jgi:putative ABC transport system ATP-binding protein
MLHTTSLKFSYTGQRQFSYPAIVLQQPGEPLLITGPSGSGKTTLLHLLAGLLRPTEGSVFVQQTDITRLSDRQLDRFRGRHIGLVFQRPHFVASISVGRNILLPTLWSRPDADAALRLQQLADRLSIGHLLAARPSRLSPTWCWPMSLPVRWTMPTARQPLACCSSSASWPAPSWW